MLWPYWPVPSVSRGIVFGLNWSLLTTERSLVPKMFHTDDADHFTGNIYMKVSVVLSCLNL